MFPLSIGREQGKHGSIVNADVDVYNNIIIQKENMSTPKKVDGPRHCYRRDPFKGNRMNKLPLDVKQPSELIGLGILTFYSWINRKGVPYVEVERLVQSEPREIEKWIEGKGTEEKNWWGGADVHCGKTTIGFCERYRQISCKSK